MVIFNSYVKLPEGSWFILENPLNMDGFLGIPLVFFLGNF
jgi:hypothetical protein